MLKIVGLSLVYVTILASCSMNFNGDLDTSKMQSGSTISGATKTSVNINTNNVGSNSGVVSSGSSVVSFQSGTVSASTQSIEPALTSDEFIFREPNGTLQVRYPKIFENAKIAMISQESTQISYGIYSDPINNFNDLGSIIRIEKSSLQASELLSELICENQDYRYFYQVPQDSLETTEIYLNAIKKLGYVTSPFACNN